MAFTAREFRDALGLFPTGVTVVTAADADGSPIGITVSSFNSVSLEPPLILFSVARSSFSLEPLSSAPWFAINVLRSSQFELSNRFARARSEKWTDVPCRGGTKGVPILRQALASFECEPYATYDGGDHVIFVGRVVHFETGPDPRPLIFFRGGYRELEEPVSESATYDAMMLHGW